LFDTYCTQNEDIKLKTRNHFRGTANALETYRPGISVGDITVDFLKRFEKQKKRDGWSQPTLDSHFRNLRRIINYFTSEVKLIPKQYEYPFGKGGYSISSFFPNKIVLKEHGIKSIINMTDFTNEKQEYVKELEYARDIFLLLYYFNGANFADALRARWDQIQGDYIIFTRKKTETTRKNNKKDIVVPITPKLQKLINKLGDRESPFILGLLKEGYEETTFENKNHKIKQQINRNLSIIAQKLNLPVPLNLSKARDCYATTLMRNGESRDNIGQMLGHSNSIVTEHYLGSLDAEKTFAINSSLL